MDLNTAIRVARIAVTRANPADTARVLFWDAAEVCSTTDMGRVADIWSEGSFVGTVLLSLGLVLVQFGY